MVFTRKTHPEDDFTLGTDHIMQHIHIMEALNDWIRIGATAVPSHDEKIGQ